MNDLFLPYELAVIADEKGFSEPCVGWFDQTINGLHTELVYPGEFTVHIIFAPTHLQIISWLANTHNITVSHVWECLGSDEWEYGYKIMYLPKEHQGLKKRAGKFQYKTSFVEGYGTYTGAWKSITEALNKGIEEAFKMI